MKALLLQYNSNADSCADGDVAGYLASIVPCSPLSAVNEAALEYVLRSPLFTPLTLTQKQKQKQVQVQKQVSDGNNDKQNNAFLQSNINYSNNNFNSNLNDNNNYGILFMNELKWSIDQVLREMSEQCTAAC